MLGVVYGEHTFLINCNFHKAKLTLTQIDVSRKVLKKDAHVVGRWRDLNLVESEGGKVQIILFALKTWSKFNEVLI